MRHEFWAGRMRGELVPEVARSPGLSDQPGRWAVASLSNYLQARQLLLAYALLRSCPELRIIATSRVREEAHRRDAGTAPSRGWPPPAG
jgi:predicted ATPase